MREWIAKLYDWFRRETIDRELTEELDFHRRQLERDVASDAVVGSSARRTAHRRLGNVLRVREAVWEGASWRWLDQLQQDVRYALRGLRRSPGFTVTVITTLALGIGANAAMFNMVDRLMFRPFAYMRDPGTVHRLYWQLNDRGITRTSTSGPYTRYLDMRESSNSFEQLAAFYERNLAVGAGPEKRERRIGAVSASFFHFFDARPVLGRFFTEDEDVTPRGADVAVLSNAFWQTAFGARNVIGEVIQVGNIGATIAGVAPEGFAGVNDANPPDIYVPITTYAASTGTDDATRYFRTYDWGWVSVLVRRKPGVTVVQAEEDATQAFRRSWIAGLADNPSRTSQPDVVIPRVAVSSVRPGGGPDPSLEARTALWLIGVAAIVLVIACANIINVLLARALRRWRETAVRLTLGVSRRRLLMQSLTEGLLLSSLGGGVALLVAQLAGAVMRRTPGTASSVSSPLFLDGRTLILTLILIVVSGIIIGVVPPLVWKGGRNLVQTLRGGVRGGMVDGARVRALLLVAQATLSVVLLIGAALFVRSLKAVRAMPLGYDAEKVLLVNRVIQGAAFEDSIQVSLRDLLLSTAQSLPGIESAAWVSSAPFVSTSSTNLHVAGVDSVARLGEFTYQATTPEYFRTMGTRIIHGRGLTQEDRVGAPDVMVVSEGMAAVLWPNEGPLGKCVRMRSETAPCQTVVGVAEDMVQQDLTGTQRYHYYLSIFQYTRTWGNGMVLRLRGDPTREAEAIRAELQAVMPGESYLTARSLNDIVQRQRRSWRMGATAFVAFGGLALLVAAVGLNGSIGYHVAQRRHELGVRVALGAQRAHILRLVTSQGLRFATIGSICGVGIVWLARDWIQPLLFRQSADDPWVFGGVGLAMVAVAVAASSIPALRAARVNPNIALRED